MEWYVPPVMLSTICHLVSLGNGCPTVPCAVGIPLGLLLLIVLIIVGILIAYVIYKSASRKTKEGNLI